MEIITLLKANIRHKRGAFKSIAILVLIISLTLTAVISLSDNIDRNLREANRAADTGDVVAYIGDVQLTGAIRDALSGSPEVERTRDVLFIAMLKSTINGKKPDESSQSLVKWEGNYPVFNEDGTAFVRSPETLGPGETYVPFCFQSLYGCEIGSKIVVSATSGDEAFTVKGFVEEPLSGAYVIGVKQIFLASEDFERLLTKLDDETVPSPRLQLYHMLHVFQAPDSSLPLREFKKAVNLESGLIDHSFAILTLEDSIGYSTLITDIGAGILYVFALLLLAIVLIVMGHSISTAVEMDYVNLGVLKSQGFTKGKIRQVFMLQYLLAQVAGALAGTLLAIPLTALLGRAFQPITGILATSDISILKCGLLVFGMLVLGGFFVFAMTARIGRISPVKAIAGGREEVYFDSRFHVPVSRHLLSAGLVLRQFASSRRRYIGTILIVSILVFFMMSMTILARCMTTNSIQESIGGIQSDIKITLSGTFTMDKAPEIEKDISGITGVTSALYAESQYLALNGTEYFCTAFDKPEKYKSVSKGRAPLYSNEIVITEIVADEIGKSIGDSVTVSYRNSSEEYLITGIYQSTSDVGRCFGMSLEGMGRLEGLKASGGFFDLADTSKSEAVVDMLNGKYGDILTAEIPESYNARIDMMEFLLNVIAGVIYAVSALFALVVVNMVCSKTFLKERRDIGIYKAIGFTAFNLRMQFALRFLAMALIGSVLGIGLCMLLNQKMLSVMLRATGITNFITDYTPFTFAAPVILVCICFFLFSFRASGRIKAVAIRELVTE